MVYHNITGCSGPGDKSLLLRMSILLLPLKMARRRLLFELLERAHCVHIETTRKLHETTCTNFFTPSLLTSIQNQRDKQTIN